MPAPGALHGLDLGALLVGLLGGLALFLFGMRQMTDAVRAVAGEGMRRMLDRFTANRVSAALTGALVTAALQSSSITTVLVVGFVSAGLMSLTQAVGVILGANVGTTVTAQIVALHVTQAALLLVALGFAVQLAGRQSLVRELGLVILGLGILFLGMNVMSDATTPLRTHGPFLEAVQSVHDPLAAVAIGATLTALVQSSSATTGIFIVLASQGFLSLEMGIALIFGSNIGTCVTAVLASVGRGRAALRAAGVHVFFNIAGVTLWLPFVGHLAELVRWISPEVGDLAPSARLAAEVPHQLANAHTLFNVVNTLLFLPFAGAIARLMTFLFPDRPSEAVATSRVRYLDPVYLTTPPLALDRLRLEVASLGDDVVGIVEAIAPEADRHTELDTERALDRRHQIQAHYEAILSYVQDLARGSLSERDARLLGELAGIANQLHNIADTVVVNLAALVREREQQRLHMSDGTRQMLADLHEEVTQAVRLAVLAVRTDDHALAERVVLMKREVSLHADALARHLGARLAGAGPHAIALYRVEATAMEILRRIYYFAKRIAKSVAEEVPEPLGEFPARIADSPEPAAAPEESR